MGHRATGCAVEIVDASPVSDHSTVENMLARYQGEIYRFALHLTRTRAGANDLYQETLRDAYRLVNQLDRTTNQRTWLYGLTTNAFLRNRRTPSRDGSFAEERADEISDALADHTARLDGRDLLRAVDASVASLPPRQWVALVQRLFHSLSYAEIATSLGCSETAARASVYTALRTLRDCLGDRV
jgi:RNA polymerase sigma-70 factor, ECF subfamily